MSFAKRFERVATTKMNPAVMAISYRSCHNGMGRWVTSPSIAGHTLAGTGEKVGIT